MEHRCIPLYFKFFVST